MYFKLILLACLLMFANAAHKKHQKRIHGGQKAKLGEFPYQVSLHVQLLTFWHSVCSGALIKPNYVLTGAECVITYPMRARAGYVNRSSSDGMYLDVAARFPHPDYNSTTMANDIALLKLNDSFPICNTIGIVNLPTANSEPTGEAILAGWGVTQAGSDQIPSNDLFDATFSIISNQACRSALGSQPPYQLQDSNVCARSPSALACSGDEGGSLVQNNVTLAVKSWIELPTCTDDGVPPVFTKVSAYVTWINSIVNK